jgi:hypothetical protein
MKYLLLLLLPLNLYAQSLFDLSEEDLNPDSGEILIKKPEKYLRDESMIYDFNTDLGIKDQRHYTGSDRNRFSIAGHISANYEQVDNVFGGEVTYMRRSSRYNQFWWGLQFFHHNTYFAAITQNSTNTGINSEGSFNRDGDVKNTVMAAGLGAGYRFKLLLDFFPTEDVFESVDVFINGVQLSETFVEKTYQGYGLTTNYGLHKRSSTNYFYGAKLSYNVASVTREAIGTERRSERTLALGWLSAALELGFFF